MRPMGTKSRQKGRISSNQACLLKAGLTDRPVDCGRSPSSRARRACRLFCRFDAGVPQQLLDFASIGALQQMLGGEAVPTSMCRGELRH